MDSLMTSLFPSTTLEGLGLVSCAWIIVNASKVLYALVNSCDFGTALTKRLPQDAFRGQVVWVSGASSGLGRQFALTLASQGATLILSSRKIESLRKVKMECLALNKDPTYTSEKIAILPFDLSSTSQDLKRVSKEALESFGGVVDVVINCGGVSTRVLARDCSSSVDEYLARVDYLGPVCIVKNLLPTLERQKKGVRIINIGSVASVVPAPARTAYCGAKHALFGYFGALSVETILTGHKDIHILNVALGSTRTPLPGNAVVEVASDGKSIKTYGKADDNISAGLDPAFVVERCLAVSHSKALHQIWLAKGKELLVLYLVQYLPGSAKSLLIKSVARKYAVTADGSVKEA